MRIGVVFPQTEIGTDTGAIRAYAQGVEDIGCQHILAYDHVVGADPASHPGWSGFYTHRDEFHEPLVLFGFLSAICSLELVTGILILPQRQTVLVAKQAAEVDVLTRGRFRLGVGLGWNAVEYEALGERFATRGRRVEDQVELMRRLWTEPVVDHQGGEHRVSGAGIAPLPVQRPIPVWFGGSSERALRRIGRIADGWMPLGRPDPAFERARSLVLRSAEDAGRDPGSLGLEGRIRFADGDLERIAEEARGWRRADATHVTLHTMDAGCKTVDDHLGALAAAYRVATETG